ncbi:hypothetical protein U1Q18_046270, partial [Sarracenia purpurea var. burkii]
CRERERTYGGERQRDYRNNITKSRVAGDKVVVVVLRCEGGAWKWLGVGEGKELKLEDANNLSFERGKQRITVREEEKGRDLLMF